MRSIQQVESELELLKKENAFQRALRDTSSLLKVHNAPSKSIFISYAWEDESTDAGLLANAKLQAWLLRLSKDLEILGVNVFLDVGDMRGKLADWMEGSITKSDYIILVGTPRYKIRASQETNVAFEYQRILQKVAESKQEIVLLPILYDGDMASSFPAQVTQHLIYDFRQQAQYYKQLLGLIKPVGIVPNIYSELESYQEYAWVFEIFTSQIRLLEAEIRNINMVKNSSNALSIIVDELPSSSPYFVGRANELAAISNDFQAKGRKLMAIQGMGGSGKSQLASEYAHNSKTSDKPYSLIRWLKADSAENLRDSYFRLGDELGVKREEYKDSEANLKKAIDYQLIRYKNILLIYDNVETLDYVESYQPRLEGDANIHMLITTRNRFTDCQSIEVKEFSAIEVQGYLTKKLQKEISLDIAEQLGQELGYLPLAIVQAAAYMVKYAKAPESFLKLLQSESRQTIIDKEVAPRLTSIANLWGVTLGKLSAPAIELLRLCTYLNPDNVPRSLLEQVTTEDARDAVLLELRFQSLLADTGSDEVFRIHRLLQEAVRREFTKQDTTGAQARALIEKAVEALKVIIGSHELTTSTEIDLFWKAHAYLNIQINSLIVAGEKSKIREDLLANLYEWAGEYQQYINLNFAEGLKLHQQALAIRESVYKDTHPDIANSLFNISNVYATQAKFVQAMEHAEKALAMRKSVYSDRHAVVAMSLDLKGDLIFTMQGKRRYADVLECYEEALEIRKAIYGNKHAETAMSLSNIGHVYYSQANDRMGVTWWLLTFSLKALRYYEESLEIRKEIYGNNHPIVAASLNEVGGSYGDRSMCHFDMALKYHDEALKIQKAIYGDKHPEIANTLLLMGRVFHRQRHFSKALNYRKEALAMLKDVYGDRHPKVADAFWSVSQSCATKNFFISACRYEYKSLVTYESVHDTWHPDVNESREKLGMMTMLTMVAPVSAVAQPIGFGIVNIKQGVSWRAAEKQLSQQERQGLYFSSNVTPSTRLNNVVENLETEERKTQAPKCVLS